MKRASGRVSWLLPPQPQPPYWISSSKNSVCLSSTWCMHQDRQALVKPAEVHGLAGDRPAVRLRSAAL
eukprot:SAG11_NODE_27506_length_332_cov_0.583691_1_plen_67_part_01